MTTEQKIKKIIEKVRRNGCKRETFMEFPSFEILYNDFFLSHEFAKAYFGKEDDYCKNFNTKFSQGSPVHNHDHNSGWQYHLQQLVLIESTEEKIEYLYKFIK